MKFLLGSLAKALATGCLAAALLLALALPPALAESSTGWQPKLNYIGHGDWSPKQSATDSQTQPLIGQGVPGLYYPPYITNDPKPDAVCSLFATATVDVILEWVPSFGAPDPPQSEQQKIYVKITSSASASADWTSGHSPSVTLTADNGMAGAITGDAKFNSSGGVRLVQAAVSRGADGKWRANAGSYTLSAKAEVQPYRYQVYFNSYGYIWEKAQVGLNLAAEKDTRAVAISRRGARSETTDAEGNKHGDTIYSYYATVFSPYGAQTGPMKNWQEFDASFIGNWSYTDAYGFGGSQTIPDVSWLWSPGYSGATWEWNKWLVSYGSQNWDIDTWKGKTGPVGAAHCTDELIFAADYAG